MNTTIVREIPPTVMQRPAPAPSRIEPPAWLTENAVLITRVAAISISQALTDIRRLNLPRLAEIDIRTKVTAEMIIEAFRIPASVNIPDADRLTVTAWLRVFANEIVDAREATVAKIEREARERAEREAEQNREVMTVAERSAFEAQKLRARYAEDAKWSEFGKELNAYHAWRRQQDEASREAMRAKGPPLVRAGDTELHPHINGR